MAQAKSRGKSGAAQPGSTPGTRERLIIEAERLFGERGIDGVTMRMVCDAAEQKFAGSVQYHFGDLTGLLQAVFDYRESQLQPQRLALLNAGREAGRLSDIRYLLRVLFEPNFTMYARDGAVSYMKCHAAYLATHRPKGIPHPVDLGSESTRGMQQAMDLLTHRLSALGPRLAALRLESVGAMCLSGMIQYATDPERTGMTPQQFFDDMLDMMAQAIAVLPRAAEDYQVA